MTLTVCTGQDPSLGEIEQRNHQTSFSSKKNNIVKVINDQSAVTSSVWMGILGFLVLMKDGETECSHLDQKKSSSLILN